MARFEWLVLPALILSSCRSNEPTKPVVLSPEKAGCGLVGLDLPDGLVSRAYFAQTQEAVQTMLDAFSSTETSSTRDIMRTLTHSNGISSPEENTERLYLDSPFTLHAIRFSLASEGQTLLLASSGGQIFVTEINGRNNDWFRNIRLPGNCTPTNAAHVQDLIFALAEGNADGIKNFFDPDGALAGIVVPTKYFFEMDDELHSGGVPEYAARSIGVLAGLQEIPVDELYVPLRDQSGVELRNPNNEIIQAPHGAEVKVLGLTQLPDGRTLALVQFLGTSALFDNPVLTNDARNVPMTPVFIDASELHVNLSRVPGVETQTEKVILATPSDMNELEKALATAIGPTATITETPLPTSSPEPTTSASPIPSATQPEIHTGFTPPTATPFGFRPPDGDGEPMDFQALLLQIGCGLTLASAGFGYYMLKTNRHSDFQPRPSARPNTPVAPLPVALQIQAVRREPPQGKPDIHAMQKSLARSIRRREQAIATARAEGLDKSDPKTFNSLEESLRIAREMMQDYK